MKMNKKKQKRENYRMSMKVEFDWQHGGQCTYICKV